RTILLINTDIERQILATPKTRNGNAGATYLGPGESPPQGLGQPAWRRKKAARMANAIQTASSCFLRHRMIRPMTPTNTIGVKRNKPRVPKNTWMAVPGSGTPVMNGVGSWRDSLVS